MARSRRQRTFTERVMRCVLFGNWALACVVYYTKSMATKICTGSLVTTKPLIGYYNNQITGKITKVYQEDGVVYYLLKPATGRSIALTLAMIAV